MATEFFRGQTYKQVTTGTTAVKARAGRLVKLVFIAVAAGTVTVYDDPGAAAGNKLYEVVNPTAGQVVDLDLPALKGITAVVGGATTVNVVYA